jgi:3-deoxy-manno-octulosonate cytidylyltransferase (CMP-KDO synthetase)
MFWHVWDRARKCPELKSVVLATDDHRIESAAKKLKVPVVMTRPDHPSGTDRVREAAEALNIPDQAVVVNVQGDEPALNPLMISQLVAPFADASVFVSTLARSIDADSAQNPDQVKVVLDVGGNALYFSRAMIPWPRDPAGDAFLGHIGIYAFRCQILKKFVALPVGRLEAIEKLEQLRLLENRIAIHVVKTEYESIGVDRPEDIDRVRCLMEKSKSLI